GSCLMAIIPATLMNRATTQAKIGLSLKNRAMLLLPDHCVGGDDALGRYLSAGGGVEETVDHDLLIALETLGHYPVIVLLADDGHRPHRNDIVLADHQHRVAMLRPRDSFLRNQETVGETRLLQKHPDIHPGQQ